jgi:1,4-dihydroxy-2-naphthoate octaprenyltransferase
LFWTLASFCAVADAAYIVWGLLDPLTKHIEWVGTIGLALVGLLSVLIAFYVQRVYNSLGGALPEDRMDANIDDGDAEQGFFSPWSWWPIMLAASAALLFLGVAVGVWISIIGVSIGIVCLVGWTYEYHRGYFSH